MKTASKTEKYSLFFTDLLDRLRELHPGLVESKVQPKKSWVKIREAGRPGFHFSCSFSRDGFRVNLTFQAKEERKNKAAFDALEKQKKKIEQEIGIPLDWQRDHGEGVKRSDIRAKIPGQITDSPAQLERYTQWALDTIPKFIEAFLPRIKKL